MSRSEYTALAEALAEVAQARACIGQNRGYEKEQAREGYECAIAETLMPRLMEAIETASGDMDARDIEKFAEDFLKKLKKAGLADAT